MSRKTSLRRLLTRLRDHRGYVILSILCALVTVALTLLLPILIGEAVDQILGPGEVYWDRIGPLLIWIGVAAALSALTGYGMNRCNNRICYRVVRDLRRDAFAVVSHMSLREVDSRPHGDIVSRVIADADAVSDGLLMGFSSLFTGGITILGTLGFMFAVNPLIAAIVVLVTPISLLVARFIARRSHALFEAQSVDRGAQTALVTEVIANLDTVRAFGQEDYYTKQFDETAEVLKKHSLGATFFSSITNPATRFVNSIVYAAVGVFGALAAVRGGITVGMLSAFLGYANQYTKPFNEISGVITELQNAFVCAGRLFELIDIPAEDATDASATADEETIAEKTAQAEKPGNTGKPADDDRVDFKDVSFSYDKEKPLIRDLNLTVEHGWRVAIVGPTGAGKTTIINLLMRFYDVDGGRIAIGGRDIRTMNRDDLRAGFGMVLQDTWLMTGTIRDNIAFGRPDATEEEIVAAARAAHAHGFISRLPQGYDTLVSDGGSLSAGERQLICIARVMLVLPPMLILDEATSSIDTRTEAQIQRAFTKLMQGRTSFIVAHRLQTIREADVILVMRDGRIVEQGRHEELLEQGGFYRELYEASRG